MDLWKGDAKFVVVEDCDETWSDMPSEEKILANTASFTCPVYFGGDPITHVTLATKSVNRARKEATQADLRQYTNQFKDAKRTDYDSCRSHDVLDLVDTRKFPTKNCHGQMGLDHKKRQRWQHGQAQCPMATSRLPRSTNMGSTNGLAHRIPPRISLGMPACSYSLMGSTTPRSENCIPSRGRL